MYRFIYYLEILKISDALTPALLGNTTSAIRPYSSKRTFPLQASPVIIHSSIFFFNSSKEPPRRTPASSNCLRR